MGRTNQSLVDRIEGVQYDPYVDESSIQASVEALSEKSEKAFKPIEDNESSGLAADLLPDLSTILMY